MFRHERREQIMRMLSRDGRVEVDALAEFFDVSVDSIRKDLQQLASQGRLKRVYGGAVKIDDDCNIEDEEILLGEPNSQPEPKRTMGSYWSNVWANVTNHKPRQEATAHIEDLIGGTTPWQTPFNTTEITAEPLSNYSGSAEATTASALDPQMLGRLEVAKRAYLEINSGDSIFLDVSRTNSLLADIIAAGDKRLIVTTNMIDVMQKLANLPHITVLGTGGYINVRLNGFVGSATVSMLEPLLFAKAFVGASGVDLSSASVTSDNIDSGSVKERVIHNASYKFLLADEEKFHHKGNYRFASLDDFSAIITDTSNTEILTKLRSQGIPVLTPL